MQELKLVSLSAEDGAICDHGRTVIETEAQVISQLASHIDHRFAEACRLLYNCQGRIVVMGVGKSGHIGRKIAATFASTGSPAFFVHPSEARHGDLGMITPHDAIFAISYSGETEEVVSLISFIKRMAIPMIALTGKPTSTLAKAATFNIDVSVAKEACPLGLAPTSSTTATLVMGDAIAMALLKMRGFTQNDFALSHPGGALGRRLLLLVEEIMHKETDIPIVAEHASLKETLVEMTHKKLGMTTVVNARQELVGVFTDGDVRRTLDKEVDIHRTPIHTLMSRNPKTITRLTPAAEALDFMETHKITSLVITDEQQKPVGIIHIHDILRAGV